MSVRVLVRRNVLDPYRSRSLFVLLGVFVLVFGLLGYAAGGGFISVPILVASIMSQLATLAALAFAYDSIAGPRERGSLRVLLSYPYTRRELVLGVLLGRIAVLALAVTVGVVATIVTLLVFGGPLDLAAIGTVFVLSVLLSTTMVAVAVGLSASVSSSTWAAVGAFGVYLLVSVFWGSVTTIVRYVLNGFSFDFGPTPEWVLIWQQLSPTQAYQTAVQVLTQEVSPDAFFTTAWFAVLVLVGWFVLATLLGLVRFDRADL